MNFIDTSPMTGVRVTGDGYLVADVRCVRTGIQTYTGAEVGKPEMATVRVYRPEAEVFSHDSLASFSHIPVTDDHPSVPVTADNWKDLARGETSGEVLRDGHRLRIPLIVKDAATIRKVQDGKRGLSAGYTCDLSFEAGQTTDGEAYDAIQKNIRANHMAIVDRGRAGMECRIGDGASDGGKDRKSWGAAPLTNDHDPKGHDMTMSTVVLGDKAVQVAATDAPAIEAFKADTRKQIADAEAAHKAALDAKDKLLADKDAELAKKDAALDAEKAKVLSDADLDKRVQERADLVSVAGAIAKDVKTAGLSDAAIKKAVVVAKIGDAAIAGKSEAYIEARFDLLADEANADPLRRAVADGVKPSADIRQLADAARAERDNSLRDAWKPQTGQAA